MTYLCYDCTHEKAASTGKGIVCNAEHTSKCEGCGRLRQLYSAQSIGGFLDFKTPPADIVIHRARGAGRLRDVSSFSVAVVLMAVALAVAVLCLAKCSDGAPESIEDWTQRAIRKLPVFYEDNPPGGVAGRTEAKEAQLTRIAHEVALASARSRKPPLSPRRWAAMLLTVGFHESAFSLRIHAGQCRPHECDHGRARGLFQGHENVFNRAYWPRMHGIENTDVQVWAADSLLRRSVGTCTPPGKDPGDFVRGIFEAYGGQRCSGKWPGAEARMATYRRLNP